MGSNCTGLNNLLLSPSKNTLIPTTRIDPDATAEKAAKEITNMQDNACKLLHEGNKNYTLKLKQHETGRSETNPLLILDRYTFERIDSNNHKIDEVFLLERKAFSNEIDDPTTDKLEVGLKDYQIRIFTPSNGTGTVLNTAKNETALNSNELVLGDGKHSAFVMQANQGEFLQGGKTVQWQDVPLETTGK